jgi:hypothetical protein
VTYPSLPCAPRASIAHSTFPTQSRWPYLPAGKSTITPLILGSICLIAAERIPRYHDTLSHLANSDLAESILNVSPGLSFAPGTDASQVNGLEPDLDLELGIGPEEICALLVYATFSCSPRSDIIATTAFEWTRGYLKVSFVWIAKLRRRELTLAAFSQTFMLPSPPPVTYGEVLDSFSRRADSNLTFTTLVRCSVFFLRVEISHSP